MDFNKIEENESCLDWPEEQVGDYAEYFRLLQPRSNIWLDFHGDPLRSELVVFSDGNHHMALRDCLDAFLEQNSNISGIFYATTPPGPLVQLLKDGALNLGNLLIRIKPHVFISPANVLDRLIADKYMAEHFPFVQNQGNVLLVKKGNPKNIKEISDLISDDIRLFISNPKTEQSSYSAYYDTLKALTSGSDNESDFLERKIKQGQLLYGSCIHHREAPQAIAADKADVAVIFYHLALRYLRIFPNLFELIPLGGSLQTPEPWPGNVIGKTHMGLIEDGGKWGQKLISFLSSKQAKDIYKTHGLLPASK
mgnify:FL=1